MDSMMNFGTPSSMLESAGKQDEVIRLKAALNEKDMELIELREQHMQLVARSQEARANWETALDTKDRAITQLEEALESSKRALEAAHRQAAAAQDEATANASATQGRIQALEAALAESHATITSQSDAMSDQARQLEAARHASTQEGAAAEARVRAVQQELASTRVQQEQLQRELNQLRAMVAEKDERLADAASGERHTKQQLEQLRQQLQEAELKQREQPSRMQQQLAELTQQLQVVQHRAAAKEASSRKYKDAVRAFKVKLQERDDALTQRQSQILELHTELSQLQRLLKLGPGLRNSMRMSIGGQQPGSPHAAAGWDSAAGGFDERAAHAAAAAMLSGGAYSPSKGGSRSGLRSRGSAEDVVAAATDELERLRVEVHGFHLEVAALQAQVTEKEALLQRALSDAAALESERTAAASRAEEATQAVLHLERQLREAQQSLQDTGKAKADVSEKLAAAEVRLEGLQSDQARWLRAEGGLRAQVQELQEQLEQAEQQQKQLQLQLKETEQREADATRRVHQLEARAEALEAKLDASSSETGQLIRRADRHETATATLKAQLESATRTAQEYEQVVHESDSRLRELSRQVIDLQLKCEELGRRCDLSEHARQQAEDQCQLQIAAVQDQSKKQLAELQEQSKQQVTAAQEQCKQQLAAAEARAAAAERRAADLDSQLLLLGRAMREAEGAALDWQAKAAKAEQARQDLGHMVDGSEAAVKQLQADLAHLQLSHSSERASAQQQEQQLRTQLTEAQAAKSAAELKLLELDRQLTEARAMLDSQERTMVMLRQQLAEESQRAVQAADLEHTVQVLEAALAEQRRTVSQLRATAAATQGESQATVASLLSELAEKSSQLVDAERRFSQLESLMGRIASRTGQAGQIGGTGLSAPPSPVLSRFGGHSAAATVGCGIDRAGAMHVGGSGVGLSYARQQQQPGLGLKQPCLYEQQQHPQQMGLSSGLTGSRDNLLQQQQQQEPQGFSAVWHGAAEGAIGAGKYSGSPTFVGAGC